MCIRDSGGVRMELVQELLQGSRRALARLISLVENNDPRKEEIMQQLFPHTGKAYLIGITGAPGAGKSSLVDRLLSGMRRSGFTVGVIAVLSLIHIWRRSWKIQVLNCSGHRTWWKASRRQKEN